MIERSMIAGLCVGFLFARLVECAGWLDITPAQAYTIESKQCAAKPDLEERRRCDSMLEKKYGRYLQEGNYPSPTPTSHPPPDRGR
jgi:hypothetical protein